MPYDQTKDPFASTASTPTSFGGSARTVSPSDSTDLNPYARLLVTVGGTLAVVPKRQANDTAVNLGTVAAGFVVPFEVRRVYLPGTTATVITIDP